MFYSIGGFCLSPLIFETDYKKFSIRNFGDTIFVEFYEKDINKSHVFSLSDDNLDIIIDVLQKMRYNRDVTREAKRILQERACPKK